MQIGQRIAAATRMTLNPANRCLVQHVGDLQVAEHLRQRRILGKALSLGTAQPNDSILIVRKQGDWLTGKMSVCLFQPEQGSLQFQFIATGQGDPASRYQRRALRIVEQDSRQSAVAFLAGVTEDQPAADEAAGQAQG